MDAEELPRAEPRPRTTAFVVPFFVFLITRRICDELKATNTHPLRSSGGTAVRRSSAGASRT
jgi:hypothetical protein